MWLKIKPLALLLALACLGTWGACSKTESGQAAVKASGPTSERPSAKQDDSAQKDAAKETDFDRNKDEFLKKAQEQLDQLDQKVDELRRRAKTAASQKQIDRTIRQLEAKRKEAAKKLDQLRSASGPAWEDLKTGVSAAINDLTAACDKAASHFKKT